MPSSTPPGDFESLARQYWNAWSSFARPPEPPAAASIPGFKEGLAFWSQLAGQGRDGIDATVERMNAQAGQWFGQMQNLAASFAGRDSAPSDIAAAWKQMLGGSAGNPMADMFARMGGPGAHGFDAWLAQVQPVLGSLRGETDALLGLPAFGLAREHQERLQQLARAQLDYQQRLADYQAQLAKAGQGAFERFERKLAERSEPGRQVDSARALFDLWIDAAEESWAEIALGSEFSRVYGELANAQMRLRLALQGQVEQLARQVGLPTRSEVDGSHRKLAQLEREVRALRRQLAAYEGAPAEPAPPPKSRPKPKPAPRKRVLPTVEAPRAANAKPRKGR